MCLFKIVSHGQSSWNITKEKEDRNDARHGSDDSLFLQNEKMRLRGLK